MRDKSIKLVKVPGSDRIAIYWEAPPNPSLADPTENYVEPSHFSIPSDNPEGPQELHFAVADLHVEEIPGHDVSSFTKELWAINGGYPPGRSHIRPAAFPGEPVTERLSAEPARMRPSPALARRQRAVAKAGAAQDRLMLKAELEEEQAEFDAWLEERKLKGA